MRDFTSTNRPRKMSTLVVIKALCGCASVVAGFISCTYWYRSSKAEVCWKDREADDIGLEAGGKEIAVFATFKKQSALGARGALAAAIAALFQLIPIAHDAWTAISPPG